MSGPWEFRKHLTRTRTAEVVEMWKGLACEPEGCCGLVGDGDVADWAEGHQGRVLVSLACLLPPSADT